MLKEGLDLGTLVHALQNHDELMFDLTHLRTHGYEKFLVNGVEMLGREIYENMYQQTRERVMSSKANYIAEFTNLGFSSTLTTFVAAALGIPDPYNMTPSEKSAIQQLHFLAAAFNAMMPGVFALSGWDLMGALSVLPESLGSWLDDRDSRWMNRGAFDLMGVNPGATVSRIGLPRAMTVYGTLPEQLRDPNSFASQLRRMLRTRRASRIAFSKLVSVPEVDMHSVIAMLFERTEHHGWIISAFNFGREPVSETIRLPGLARKSAQLVFSTHGKRVKNIRIADNGGFPLDMEPIQGEVFIIE